MRQYFFFSICSMLIGCGLNDRDFTTIKSEKKKLKAELNNLKIKSEVLPNETHRSVFGVGFTNGLRFIYAY